MNDRALFLDRDGTLIVDRHYLSDPAGVELLPGVRDALHRCLAHDFRLFLFTNQSGVGRGMFPIEAVQRCNARMLELLELPAPGFSGICNATESPDEPAVYRKPSPRFILEMMARYSLAPDHVWMIGDRWNDVQAGLNAGVRAVLLEEGTATALPERVCRRRDLAEFCRKLLEPAP